MVRYLIKLQGPDSLKVDNTKKSQTYFYFKLYKFPAKTNSEINKYPFHFWKWILTLEVSSVRLMTLDVIIS